MLLKSRSFGLVLIVVMIPTTFFAGCFGHSVTEDSLPDEHWLLPVEERNSLWYDDSDVFSRVSITGIHTISGVSSIYVPVPAITLSDGGAGLTGEARVHLGLWIPVMDGCPTSADATDWMDECKVPVIAEIGPYYADGDVDALTPAERLGRFLIENFVPHGFAVAQVSVFGTGESNHCMDLMGLDEQAGIKAAIDWLGEQPWSNGHVGAIGKSYDGSTPWNAAASGSEYLSTIVPMSGLIGLHELMWRNGSMEARGAIMHNGVYGSFGLDGDLEDTENACEGYMEGYYAGVGAYLTGDNLAWTGSDYWEEREFLSRAIANYQGSVYIIHGMQDWNVDPHMAFPTHNTLLSHQFEVKGMYGQWGHDYPDRNSSHALLEIGRGGEAFPYTVRWDWADDLLEWFDYYLKGKGPLPRLHAEIQDNHGGWRVESQYPPEDLVWNSMSLGSNDCILVNGNGIITSSSQTVLQCRSFDKETRIAGMPRVSIDATISPTATSGHLFAEISQSSNGIHLGHAVMDLRFHEGGSEGTILLPGQTVLANMEFFAMDVVIPKGDGITLTITQTGEDYIPSPISTQPVFISLDGSSLLSLPTVQRSCLDLFLPPMLPDYDFCENS